MVMCSCVARALLHLVDTTVEFKPSNRQIQASTHVQWLDDLWVALGQMAVMFGEEESNSAFVQVTLRSFVDEEVKAWSQRLMQEIEALKAKEAEKAAKLAALLGSRMQVVGAANPAGTAASTV